MQEIRMGKKVFVTTNDQDTMAYFGWQDGSTALYGLKHGYKNAAENLVDFALEKGAEGDIETLDTYIFPILFLYRHSLEISLKIIYYTLYDEILQGHELNKLWETVFEKVIKKIDTKDFLKEVMQHKEKNGLKFINWSMDDIDFDELHAIFDELQEFDKKSDVWRYMIDKKGQLYFADAHHIDYKNLNSVLGETYTKLEYLYTIVSHYMSG